MAVDRRGGLWVGCRNEPYLRFFNSAWRVQLSVPVTGAVFALFVDSQGDFWFGGRKALLHFDGPSWERIPVPDTMTALAEDRHGRLWAAGAKGFYVYDPTGE
jgi:ligand-binding sensor domain-containing protein